VKNLFPTKTWDVKIDEEFNSMKNNSKGMNNK